MSLLRPRRVFIGFSNTASYYSALAEGFRAIGYDVEYAAFHDESPMLRRYASGRPSRLYQLFLWGRAADKRWAGRFGGAVTRLTDTAYLLYCALRCDIFIFSSSSSFLPQFRDLGFLRWIGRRTIFTFLGSRSRPAFLNGVYTNGSPPISARRAVERAEAARADLNRIGRLATGVIENPAAAQLHSHPFVDYGQIGFPNTLAAGVAADMAEQTMAEQKNDSARPVRILHAPSKTSVKGSDRIRQMIEALRAEGLDIDFVLIHGLPNAAVIAELRRCDFVIDQCFSDVPVAGFACEAAAFGKPAVVGGYAAAELGRFGPYPGLPTALYVHPDAMQDLVRRLVLDAPLRRQLGEQARALVLQHWSAAAVAQRYLQVARGDIPDHWRIAPQEIGYWQGCGAPESVTKAFIAAMPEPYRLRAIKAVSSPQVQASLASFAAPSEAAPRNLPPRT